MANHHTPAFPRLSDSEKGRMSPATLPPDPSADQRLFPRRHYNKLSYASRCVDLPGTKSHPSANKDTYAHTHAHACARAMMGIWATARPTWFGPMRNTETIAGFFSAPPSTTTGSHARSAGRLGGTRKQAGTLPVSRKGIRQAKGSKQRSAPAALLLFPCACQQGPGMLWRGDELRTASWDPRAQYAQSVGVSGFAEDAVRPGKHHNAFNKPRGDPSYRQGMTEDRMGRRFTWGLVPVAAQAWHGGPFFYVARRTEERTEKRNEHVDNACETAALRAGPRCWRQAGTTIRGDGPSSMQGGLQAQYHATASVFPPIWSAEANQRCARPPAVRPSASIASRSPLSF
ncbi:hypothetical protein EDB84DRAFT_1595625 [Lactarius hengduanensis]|nr:hypothetical protein EDB84DRAFT_1595625 [Lactarius hengduanensis]